MNQVLILHIDGLNFSKALLNHKMNQNKELEMITLTGTKKQIIDRITKADSRDIVILDVRYPKINPTKILKIFTKMEQFPHVIVLTTNKNSIEELKPYKKYIDIAIPVPHSMKRILWGLREITKNPEQTEIEKLISNELDKFDISKITMGYRYMVDAILFALEDVTLVKNMRKGLYAKIAQKYDGVNVINVKWTIDKCVLAVTRYTNTNKIKEYFLSGTKKTKLNTKLFILTIVRNLKDDYKILKENKKELILKE